MDDRTAVDSLRFAVSPNPTSGKVRIQFTLPVAGKTLLRIYDVAGRRVKELASGDLPAGRASYVWDLSQGPASAVPSGVYFARLETRIGTRVVRFVLIR